MKLSISNIAWEEAKNEEMYQYISKMNYNAIEIAPTKLVGENPYQNLEKAKYIANKLYKEYNLNISSMQSIWYGVKECIFTDKKSREKLIEYTKKSIDFAKIIDCKNLVFGCPKNRVIRNIKTDYSIAIEFFRDIGKYAKSNEVYFSIEANPIIYNTNFIVETKEAIQIVKDINEPYIKVNLDIGTIIQNNEDINILKDNINLINHVHISEPNLEIISKREIHKELAKVLKQEKYKNYVSIEMKQVEDIQKIKDVMEYIKGVFE